MPIRLIEYLCRYRQKDMADSDLERNEVSPDESCGLRGGVSCVRPAARTNSAQPVLMTLQIEGRMNIDGNSAFSTEQNVFLTMHPHSDADTWRF